jgi:LysM repeat protein
MKILQIFGAVVAVHLLAFIFIFASPGCQSSSRNVPTPDATLPSGPSSASAITYASESPPPPVDLATTPAAAGAPGYASDRATPTRPGSPNAAAIMPARPTTDVAPVTTYTVERGDSLWSVAKKNHLTVAELAKANNIGVSTTLHPGKKLIIPVKNPPPAPAPVPADLGATPASLPAATPARGGGEAVKHTVQPGESLGTIARKYQVTVGELAAANSITDPAKIRAGQTLVIPGFKAVGGKTAAKPAPKPAASAAQPAAAAPAETPAANTPRFEIKPPPPGQDLDAGLKNTTTTDVPTIKVEEPKAEEVKTDDSNNPPKN